MANRQIPDATTENPKIIEKNVIDLTDMDVEKQSLQAENADGPATAVNSPAVETALVTKPLSLAKPKNPTVSRGTAVERTG